MKSSQNKGPVSAGAVVAALGVVFGDIGTSPLYAFKESLAAAGFAPGDSITVLGLLSLIFWSLAIIVSVKYLAVIMRADNHGEGGILSLVALVQQRFGTADLWARRAVALGVLGAALFYCDALITPAISVLSAVEGLTILDPGFKRAVLPVTLGIIVALFAIQRSGTERVGRLFGPIMILWFGTLAVLGAVEILSAPRVLAAVNPWYAVALFANHPGLSLIILGAVFLAVTGAEALYADMGHFGRRPVRLAWLVLVWPALVTNYFGQGALLLNAAAPIENPFYALAPQALLPLLVLLSTAATVIASQATISGAFSVTREAVQLDLLPRVRVLQTSDVAQGQIYVPAANLFMFVAVVLFVIGFGSSGALSAAYGASVVGTMIITTLLGALIARWVWNWSWARVGALFGLLLLVDMAFVAGNLTKIASGGWVPLALAAIMFAMFVTWRDGRQKLRAELERRAVPDKKLPELLSGKARTGLRRVPGEQLGFRADRAAAQPRAQQGLSRADRDPAHRDPARAARRPAVSRDDRRDASRRVRHARALRIHGDARRQRCVAQRTAPGALGLHRGRIVLPRLAPGARAPVARSRRPQGARVRLPATAQRAGRGVLQHADARRRRARDRYRDLIGWFAGNFPAPDWY
jgi:KUP system potassium uptake protein